MEELLRKACLDAKEKAYCPYSKFRVGCAVLTTDDLLYTGCNVENASYGGAICAERTAICKAVSEGHQKFKALGVITDLQDPATPCGICRQFIREFGKDTLIFCFGNNGKTLKMTLEEFLPKSFGPEDLNKP
eukprot:NODE_60_length_27201_cov_1.043318.p21 type:complete len:132 gc:universal NODE_60_length_27201_cov_1.043318:14836-15231(+)